MGARAARGEVGSARMAAVVAGAALAGLAASPPVRAQGCETTPSAVLETFPASGSHEQPRNGLVVVVYCPPEDPFVDRSAVRLLRDLGVPGPGCSCEVGECLPVSGASRCLHEVPGEVVVEGERARLTTREELGARTRHVIEAPEPSATMRVAFTTGDLTDQAPPVFGGPTSLRVVGCGPDYPASVACSRLGEGYLAVVEAGAAEDAAGRVNLEYSLVQISGDRLVPRGRVRGDGASSVTVTAFVPATELGPTDRDRLCFLMSVADPYGNETTAEDPVCALTPDFSPFGSACRAAPGGRAPAPWAGLALALGVAAARLSASRRRAVPRP